MKKLCGSEAIALLPVSNGIIIIRNSNPEGAKVSIQFDLYSTETMKTIPISKTDYLLNKFGNCFEKITAKTENIYSCKTAILPDGKVLVLYQDGHARIFNASGLPIRDFDMKYKGDPPSDIAFCHDDLFASFANENVIVKYNPYTLGIQVRYGSKDSASFGAPTSLCGADDKLYVCNSNSNKISILEPKTYNLIDYAEVKEPLLQYIRLNTCELLLLQSGVYKA